MMLQCLRGRAFPLAIRLLKNRPPGCSHCSMTLVAARLYRRPPSSRPVPALNLSTFNLTTRLGLHTSSQQQRRKKEIKEGLLSSATRRQWQELKKIPKLAFVLGAVGTMPFVIPPVAMCFMQVYVPSLASLQVMYGACVLSFIGGVRWGYTMPANSPASLNLFNLVLGAFLPYLAFYSLLFMGDTGPAMLGLGVGFGIGTAADTLGMKDLDLAPIAPLWYKWMSVVLTTIVLASFLFTLRCSVRYPEITIDDPNVVQEQLKKRR